MQDVCHNEALAPTRPSRSVIEHLEGCRLVASNQAPVVRMVDSTIQWINLYAVFNTIGFPNTYPLDSESFR